MADEGLIPALSRIRWSLLTVPVLLCVAGGFTALFSGPPGVLATALTLLAVGFVSLAAAMVLVRKRTESLRSLVEARDGRVCTECGYDVSDLCINENGQEVERVRCPECGRDLSLSAIRARWYTARFWMP